MSDCAIVMGVSAGGMNVLKYMINVLPAGFNSPIIVVQHLSPRSDSAWIRMLNANSKLPLREAREKETITAGNIYFAPPNYHLLVERTRTFSLSVDERVNFARPSIDVLFESAADVYREKLTGIILTGSSRDGANGLRYIKSLGGRTIVQDPSEAEAPFMPATAISTQQPDYILPIREITAMMISLDKQKPLADEPHH